MENLSIRIPEQLVDEVKRPTFVDTVKRIFANNNLVILEGEQGSGKTLFLAQFARVNSKNCLCYFIDPSDRFTFTGNCFQLDIANQISNYLYNTDFKDNTVPDNFILAERLKLEREIKKRGTDFYIIIDGLDTIPFEDAAAFLSFFNDLPLKKVKLLLSGELSKVIRFFNEKTISYRPQSIIFFTPSETKEYFSDFSLNQEQLNEIYRIGNNGHPGRLAIIKRSLKETTVEEFLKSDLTEKSNLIDLEWNQLPISSTLKGILCLLSFSESKLSSLAIASILKITQTEVEKIVSDRGFILVSNQIISFISEEYKAFAIKKYESERKATLDLLIDYYTTNLSDDQSILNLPTLFLKAKRYSELLNHLTLKKFIQHIERTGSLFFVSKQFDVGLNASKEVSDSQGEYLKFALYKSSLRSLDNEYPIDSEIQALVNIKKIGEAKAKVASVQIKENRFKSLCLLVKIMREANEDNYDDLVNLIRDLYQEIDLDQFKENAIEISSLLIYSDPNLAIDIIERFTHSSSSKNGIDYAFAYLSLFVNNANTSLNKNLIDVEEIKSKIKDSELKAITEASIFIGRKYSANSILELVKKISEINRRITILRNWLKMSDTTEGVSDVLEYALQQVIQSSSESVPNATVLYEICTPLSKITDPVRLNSIISQIDSQKTTINTPTRDFIKLQLLIAKAECKFNFQAFKDRILETFYTIDDIKDISLKNDCTVFLLKILVKENKLNDVQRDLTNTSLLDIIKGNCLVLLESTAYQSRIFENTIKNLVDVDLDFVLNLISQINISDRRIYGYRLAALQYLRDKPTNSWDKARINFFLDKVERLEIKEEILIKIFDLINEIKENDTSKTPDFSYYLSLIPISLNPETSTYLISRAIKILSVVHKEDSKNISNSFKKLKVAWESIDSVWDKIDIGYKICAYLGSTYESEAMEYYKLSSNLKENENLTTANIANVYVASIRLSIKALEGTIDDPETLNKNIGLLRTQIEKIKSLEVQITLWNELALLLYKGGLRDKAKEIVNHNIVTPLQGSISEISRLRILESSGFGLYVFHADFLFMQLEKVDESTRDRILSKVVSFICCKISPSEPILYDINISALNYDEFLDIIKILKQIKDDTKIYNTIEKVVDYAKISRLPLEQKNEITRLLFEVIKVNLPSTKGIQHDGYKIVASAKVLELKTDAKADFDKLLIEASAIKNTSDRALIHCFLSENSVFSKRERNELLQKSLSIAKEIPSNYDKFNRIDAVLTSLMEYDGAQFKSKMKEIFNEVVFDKNSGVNTITSMIDLAQQHDSKLAESLVSILDSDPSRRNLRKPLMKRIERKVHRKVLDEDISKLSELKSALEVAKYSENKLAELNSGKIIAKEVLETLGVLENISKLPLESSFDCASYFISNAIKKCQKSPKGKALLNTIFNATIQNTNLIDLLSTDSLVKMRTKMTFSEFTDSKINPRISFDDRDKAMDYLSNWITENVSDKIYFIDPYFDENDLEFLSLVKSCNSNIEIVIVSSKNNGKNSHEDNNEVYKLKWRSISNENPPLTRIDLVHFSKKGEPSPIHDRWLTNGGVTKGLKIGTSFNTLGRSKESQILVLDTEGLQTVGSILNDYVINRKFMKNGQPIIYGNIYLFDF